MRPTTTPSSRRFDAAEEGGLDLVGVQDHPYQRRFLDTYSLIADLLARTDRLRFFPDVTSLAMRDPPMIAKAATSMDVMSGGRFELGLGAGNFWDAVEGMGRARRTNREAFEALEEAISIIRAALDVGPERRVIRGPGPHYPIPGYPAGPPPAHRVGMWLGRVSVSGAEPCRSRGRWLDPVARLRHARGAEAGWRGHRPRRNRRGPQSRDITRLVNFNGVIGEGERARSR